MGGEESEASKSRCEKSVWWHSLQSRMSRAIVSWGGGFSVRRREGLAEMALSVWMGGGRVENGLTGCYIERKHG